MAKRRGKVSKYKVRRVSSSAVSSRNFRFIPYALGHSLGLISILVMLMYAVMAWFSGYNTAIIVSQFPLAFSFNDWTLVIGLIQTYVLSYIGGWIFAKIYNSTLREI